jgi:hypothetical protein
MKIAALVALLFTAGMANAQSGFWLVHRREGLCNPTRRIKITVTNPLNVAIKACPIVVPRTSLPMQNIPERWIGIVDPKASIRP